EKRFGNLQGDTRRRAEEDFVRQIVDSKRYSTVEGLSSLLDLSSEQLRALHEPIVDFAIELGSVAQQIAARQGKFNETVSRWRPVLLRGMSEMKGSIAYPDANRTLRFSYGAVKGYVPHDAAVYEAFTNLIGVIEKDHGREP